VDTNIQTEEELTLQKGEKALWESEGGPERFDKVAWGFSLFWGLLFVLMAAVLFSVLLEQVERTGWSGTTLVILLGLIASLATLMFLIRHIYRELNREIAMNYAITNQRLVVATRSGSRHTSFTGRPFSALDRKARGDVHDITLKGTNPNDPGEVVVQLLGVKDGEKAEKLLLKSFMQKSGAKT
jgi:hypothetical protein